MKTLFKFFLPLAYFFAPVVWAADYQHKGCFAEGTAYYHLMINQLQTTLPVATDYKTYVYSTKSPFSTCMSQCQSEGYPYAGLQISSTGGRMVIATQFLCTCVLDFDFLATPSTLCTTACPAGLRKTCGGFGAVDLYYTVRAGVQPCPTNLDGHMGPDGTCYIANDTIRTDFAGTRKFCVRRGGDIVTNFDMAKFNLIHKFNRLYTNGGFTGTGKEDAKADKVWVGMYGHPITKRVYYTSHAKFVDAIYNYPWHSTPIDELDYPGCVLHCTGHAAFEQDVVNFNCTVLQKDIGGAICMIPAQAQTTPGPTATNYFTTSHTTSSTTSGTTSQTTSDTTSGATSQTTSDTTSGTTSQTTSGTTPQATSGTSPQTTSSTTSGTTSRTISSTIPHTNATQPVAGNMSDVEKSETGLKTAAIIGGTLGPVAMVIIGTPIALMCFLCPFTRKLKISPYVPQTPPKTALLNFRALDSKSLMEQANSRLQSSDKPRIGDKIGSPC